jgi:hypothetical protein
MTMKKLNLIALSISAVALATGATLMGCGDDTTGVTTVGDAGTVDSGPTPDATVDSGTADSASDTGTDGATADASDAGAADAADADGGPLFPAPPALGTQIDRFGRPAINTALTGTFAADPPKGPMKDAYNANSDAGSWSSYIPEFEKNLAILDSLDTNDAGAGCGTQAFAGPSADAGAARYATLAGVLANDRLWLDTSSTNCTQYLGVELVATGVITNPDGGKVDQCGGRTLGEDVIQTTYSAVALGTLSGFGSGVSANPSKTTVATFPYFAVVAQ